MRRKKFRYLFYAHLRLFLLRLAGLGVEFAHYFNQLDNRLIETYKIAAIELLEECVD